MPLEQRSGKNGQTSFVVSKQKCWHTRLKLADGALPLRPELDDTMDADAAALQGGLSFVPLQQLVHGSVQQAQDDLREMCTTFPGAADADR